MSFVQYQRLAHKIISDYKEILKNDTTEYNSNSEFINGFISFISERTNGYTLIDSVEYPITYDGDYFHKLLFRGSVYICFHLVLNKYKNKEYYITKNQSYEIYIDIHEFISDVSKPYTFENAMKIAGPKYNYLMEYKRPKVSLKYYSSIDEYIKNNEYFTIPELLKINNISEDSINRKQFYNFLKNKVALDEVHIIVNDNNEYDYYFESVCIHFINEIINKYIELYKI